MWRWSPPWHWVRRCGRRKAFPMNKIATMTSALLDSATLETRKNLARAWFERLRDDMCAAFEAVEDALPTGSPLAERAAGRFKRTPWQRADHSGQPGGGGV